MTFPRRQAQALMPGLPCSVNSASANIPLSLRVPEFLVMSLRAILAGEVTAGGPVPAAVCAGARVCMHARLSSLFLSHGSQLCSTVLGLSHLTALVGLDLFFLTWVRQWTQGSKRGSGVRRTWAHILVLPLARCVDLNKLFNRSALWFTERKILFTYGVIMKMK